MKKLFLLFLVLGGAFALTPNRAKADDCDYRYHRSWSEEHRWHRGWRTQPRYYSEQIAPDEGPRPDFRREHRRLWRHGEDEHRYGDWRRRRAWDRGDY